MDQNDLEHLRLRRCVRAPTFHLEKLSWLRLITFPSLFTFCSYGKAEGWSSFTSLLCTVSFFFFFPLFMDSHLRLVFFRRSMAAMAPSCMIAPPGSYLIEDPITHEKWALCCNGWLNPETLRSKRLWKVFKEERWSRGDDLSAADFLLRMHWRRCSQDVARGRHRLDVWNVV